LYLKTITKKSVEGKEASAGTVGYSIDKKTDRTKQIMIHELENQFNEGVKRKTCGKNGLGFN